MNVFLLTDLEGIAGVDDIEYMDRSGEKYARARGYLTHTINLAAETCFACGAKTVSFLDGHGGGGNILEAEIDPRARRCSLAEWQALLREGRIDCQIELGSHARAGTLNGFLDHTLTSRQWFCHKVNGREMSELSLHALLCGRYGVPIAGCIGDETACAQAAEYIPGIRTGAVKKASCRNLAVTYPDADAILVRTVQEALKAYREIPLFGIPGPLTAEVTYYRTDMCDEAFARATPGTVRVDARTLRRTVEHLERYEDLRF